MVRVDKKNSEHNVQIKLHIGSPVNEKRRFSIPLNTPLLQFENTLKQLLPTRSIQRLQYLDDEEEWVSFSTEREWKEALSIFQQEIKDMKKGLDIKVHLVVRKETSDCKQNGLNIPLGPNDAVVDLTEAVRGVLPGQWAKYISPKKNAISQPYVHNNIICDNCGRCNIVGTRFKCKNCDDYDLCGKCFTGRDKAHDSSHVFCAMTGPQGGFDKVVTHIIYE